MIGKTSLFHLATSRLKPRSCQIAFSWNYLTKWSRMDVQTRIVWTYSREYVRMFVWIQSKIKVPSLWIRFGSKESKTEYFETSLTSWVHNSTTMALSITGPGPMPTNNEVRQIEKRNIKANLIIILDFWRSMTCLLAIPQTCYNSSASISATAGLLAYLFQALPTNTTVNINSSKNVTINNKHQIACVNKWKISREWRWRHASWV